MKKIIIPILCLVIGFGGGYLLSYVKQPVEETTSTTLLNEEIYMDLSLNMNGKNSTIQGINLNGNTYISLDIIDMIRSDFYDTTIDGQEITINEKLDNTTKTIVKEDKEIDNDNVAKDSMIEYEGILYEKLYDLGEGEKVYYSTFNRGVLFLHNHEYQQVIEDGNKMYKSMPTLSPNKEKLAFISPYEFELDGDVYLYNTKDGSIEKIIDVHLISGDNTAKVVKWLDDDNLLVIIGFACGTVTKGGNLYLYNLPNKELTLIKEPESMSQEITDVDVATNGLIIDIITWNEDFTDYIKEQEVLMYGE